MEDPSFIFSSGPIELKQEGKNIFIEGYITTSDLDLVDDIVTKGCILDTAEQMKSRVIKVDVEHESFKGKSDIELEINKTIIPVAKIDDFIVDKKGLKIRAMLNRHSNRFEETKGSIEDGFLDAFSIAYIPVKSTLEKREGKDVRLLDKIKLLNVALTGNPVNTQATMTNIFAKSLKFLESKENQDHSSNDNTKLKEVIKMSDEENKEAEETSSSEESTEAESESTEESTESESEEKAKKKQADNEEDEDEDEEENPKKKKVGKKVGKKDEDATEEAESEESKDEADEDQSSEEAESNTEEKSELEELKAEMIEVKAALKRPLLKSRVEQATKALRGVEKSLNPLDLIA